MAGGALFPAPLEGLQRILVPHIEETVEGVTFRLSDPFHIEGIADIGHRGMVRRHKERKFGRGCVESWRRDRSRLAAEARTLLEPFDLMLADNRPFLLGHAPVYTDFALFGILGNLTHNNWNPFPEGLDRLARWFDRLGNWRAPS